MTKRAKIGGIFAELRSAYYTAWRNEAVNVERRSPRAVAELRSACYIGRATSPAHVSTAGPAPEVR